MTDPKKSIGSFLQRWSRRKRAATNHVEEAERQVDRAASSSADLPSTRNPVSVSQTQPVTAAGDIGRFLQPDVPADVARAALRRAWIDDPTIRDFIGIADNQWDFTKNNGVPGFGTLTLTPDLERLVSELFGPTPVLTPRAGDKPSLSGTEVDCRKQSSK